MQEEKFPTAAQLKSFRFKCSQTQLEQLYKHMKYLAQSEKFEAFGQHLCLLLFQGHNHYLNELLNLVPIADKKLMLNQKFYDHYPAEVCAMVNNKYGLAQLNQHGAETEAFAQLHNCVWQAIRTKNYELAHSLVNSMYHDKLISCLAYTHDPKAESQTRCPLYMAIEQASDKASVSLLDTIYQKVKALSAYNYPNAIKAIGSALNFAIAQNNRVAIDYLITQAKIRLNAHKEKGWSGDSCRPSYSRDEIFHRTALEMAIEQNDVKTVVQLLDSGDNIGDVSDYSNNRPSYSNAYEFCVTNNYLKYFKLLLNSEQAKYTLPGCLYELMADHLTFEQAKLFLHEFQARNILAQWPSTDTPRNRSTAYQFKAFARKYVHCPDFWQWLQAQQTKLGIPTEEMTQHIVTIALEEGAHQALQTLGIDETTLKQNFHDTILSVAVDMGRYETCIKDKPKNLFATHLKLLTQDKLLVFKKTIGTHASKHNVTQALTLINHLSPQDLYPALVKVCQANAYEHTVPDLLQVVKTLLAKGALSNPPLDSDITPMRAALANNTSYGIAVRKLLKQHGAELKTASPKDLAAAIEGEDRATVEALLKFNIPLLSQEINVLSKLSEYTEWPIYRLICRQLIRQINNNPDLIQQHQAPLTHFMAQLWDLKNYVSEEEELVAQRRELSQILQALINIGLPIASNPDPEQHLCLLQQASEDQDDTDFDLIETILLNKLDIQQSDGYLLEHFVHCFDCCKDENKAHWLNLIRLLVNYYLTRPQPIQQVAQAEACAKCQHPNVRFLLNEITRKQELAAREIIVAKTQYYSGWQQTLQRKFVTDKDIQETKAIPRTQKLSAS